jgi:hypothetical protein
VPAHAGAFPAVVAEEVPNMFQIFDSWLNAFRIASDH